LPPTRILALAADYDGTLAHHDRVDAPTVAALGRLRGSGRSLILVTGRVLAELFHVFPRVDLFDRVVAENGALLYRPDSREETLLAEPPPPSFLEAIRARGVDPVSVGRVIVATWQPHDQTIADVIQSQHLELEVILNKRAVMVLPSGVNKGSGLLAALRSLGIDPREVVAVGDAENDVVMFEVCGFSAAVANALPVVKARAQIVTQGERGAGVAELIDAILDGRIVSSNHKEDETT
jgi:HAD superfamily hydrolase (TIGR01484 family)